jgi:hypothetical protein
MNLRKILGLAKYSRLLRSKWSIDQPCNFKRSYRSTGKYIIHFVYHIKKWNCWINLVKHCRQKIPMKALECLKKP